MRATHEDECVDFLGRRHRRLRLPAPQQARVQVRQWDGGVQGRGLNTDSADISNVLTCKWSSFRVTIYQLAEKLAQTHSAHCIGTELHTSKQTGHETCRRREVPSHHGDVEGVQPRLVGLAGVVRGAFHGEHGAELPRPLLLRDDVAS